MKKVFILSMCIFLINLLLASSSFTADFSKEELKKMENFIQAFTQPGTPEYSAQPTPDNIADWIMFANAYNSISYPERVRKLPQSNNPNAYQSIEARIIQDTIKKYFGEDIFTWLKNPLVLPTLNQRGANFDGKNFIFGAGDAGEQCKIVVKTAQKLPNGNILVIAHEEWPEEYERDGDSIDLIAILKKNPFYPDSWALKRIIPTD